MRFLPVVSFVLLASALHAQDIRPVRDNVGFCWTASEMDSLIALLQRMPASAHSGGVSGECIGGISPHDDYLYAGRVYYPLYPLLHAKEVIIIGVTHGTVRKEVGEIRNVLLFDDFAQWVGPYGPVPVSPLRGYITARLDTSFWRVHRRAHEIEHSIEATIPFLQHFNRGVQIVPIMVTVMPLERMQSIADTLAGIVASYMREHHLRLGRDVAVLISADANHYGLDFSNAPYGEDSAAHAEGVGFDRKLVDDALVGTITDEKVKVFTQAVWGVTPAETGKTLWCGKFSVPMGLLVLRRVAGKVAGAGTAGELLRYSDTWTEKVLPLRGTALGTTAPFSLKHWVGFCAVGFYAAE